MLKVRKEGAGCDPVTTARLGLNLDRLDERLRFEIKRALTKLFLIFCTIVAVFHASFHPTRGNVIDWCLKSDPSE